MLPFEPFSHVPTEFLLLWFVVPRRAAILLRLAPDDRAALLRRERGLARRALTAEPHHSRVDFLVTEQLEIPRVEPVDDAAGLLGAHEVALVLDGIVAVEGLKQEFGRGYAVTVLSSLVGESQLLRTFRTSSCAVASRAGRHDRKARGRSGLVEGQCRAAVRSGGQARSSGCVNYTRARAKAPDTARTYGSHTGFIPCTTRRSKK